MLGVEVECFYHSVGHILLIFLKTIRRDTIRVRATITTTITTITTLAPPQHHQHHKQFHYRNGATTAKNTTTTIPLPQ